MIGRDSILEGNNKGGAGMSSFEGLAFVFKKSSTVQRKGSLTAGLVLNWGSIMQVSD